MAESNPQQDIQEMQESWSRMVRQMNEAVSRSVEQNVEAQAQFMESWADAIEGSMPEEGQLEESMDSYSRAYDVWMEAADRMYERVADAASGEEVPVTELRDIWLQTANEAFKEVMGTSAFAAATGNAVEAAMETQRQAQAATGETLAAMGMATGEDVDEVAERLVELERRQHAVEKKLDRVLEHLEE